VVEVYDGIVDFYDGGYVVYVFVRVEWVCVVGVVEDCC